MVLSVVLPLIGIDFRQTRDQKLQLLLVEDGNQFWGNDFMETCN